MTNATLSSALNAIVDELLLLASDIEESSNYYPRGTILKALPEQGRFQAQVYVGITRRRHLQAPQW
jgi:hypothetical protein